MTLPELSIRRPVFTWMLFFSILIFGGISFSRLGSSLLPDVDFPYLSISFAWSGASPEVIESQVLDVAEDTLMQINGLKSMTSNAQQNVGTIALELEVDRDVDEVMQEVSDRLQSIASILPALNSAPTIRKTNPENLPIILISLTSDDSKIPLHELMLFTKNVLRGQFTKIPGVADVTQGGYIDPALRLDLQNALLKRYDFTAEDVMKTLESQHQEFPIGSVIFKTNPHQEYPIRILGEAQTPEEFGNIPLQQRLNQGINYQPIRLHQLGQVSLSTVDVRKIARIKGQRAIGLEIIKSQGASAAQIGKLVRKRIEELNPTLPKGYQLGIRIDTTVFIEKAVHHLVFNLVISVLLTSVICFLFLGSFQATLNILLSIPISILGSFIAFYFFHFTLNTFTLLGLSLAIGICVDDAIMVLENITRHMEMKKSSMQAALDGTREISFAALSATIAVIAIFFPVIFMRGIIGKYFFQYGMTVSIAVTFSLLEALTLTPMRCAYYLKKILKIIVRMSFLIGWISNLESYA